MPANTGEHARWKSRYKSVAAGGARQGAVVERDAKKLAVEHAAEHEVPAHRPRAGRHHGPRARQLHDRAATRTPARGRRPCATS